MQRFLVTVTYFLVPTFVYAQGFKGLVNSLVSLITSVIPLLVGLAFIVFIWGLIKFLFHTGDGTAVQEGKNIMIAGIIGIFVIVAVWGLIQIIGGTFRIL